MGMDPERDIFDELAEFFDPDIVAACRVDDAQLLGGLDPLNTNLDPGFVAAPEAQLHPAQHPAPLYPVPLYQEPLPTYNELSESSVEPPEPQVHVCHICNKQHASPATLVRHMRFHTGERPFRCQTCGKTFAQKGDLKVHARSHTGETPFQCWQCGKQFAQFTGLKYHERIHSGERPVQCTQCGRAFVHTGDLNVHMRTHTGEKPFACPVCHKRFTQRGSVRVHMRRKHDQIITKVPRTPDPGLARQHSSSVGQS